MQIHENSIARELVQSIADTRQSLHDQAERFPVSREDYLALPLEQRMETAKEITRHYASMRVGGSETPSESWPAEATINTPEPGILLEARIAFRPQEGRSAMNDYQIIKDEDIAVWVRATDAVDRISTRFTRFGEIAWGAYKIEDGSRYGEWKHDTHVDLPTTNPPSLEILTKHTALDSAEAGPVIEVVDAAVGNLIEGKISRHRRLGGIALNRYHSERV